MMFIGKSIHMWRDNTKKITYTLVLYFDIITWIIDGTKYRFNNK